MKILQVLLPQGMGGVEKIASQLVLNSKDGLDVCIAIDERYYVDFQQYFSVPVRNIYCMNCESVLSTIQEIIRVIKQVKPSVIHTHARKECMLVALVNKAIPHIRTQHMAQKAGKKVTCFEKRLLRKRVDYWGATSKFLLEHYLMKKDYIDPGKVEVIYNGVSNAKVRTDFLTKHHFCIISRLTVQKGIDIILSQISDMPELLKNSIKIDIWGEGPELKNITKQINNLRLQNIVSYKGICKQPINYFEDYDTLLMPSRYEGLPLTMLEAMSTGTPVATHDVGCVKEFIRSGKNGWIINEEFTWQDFFGDLIREEYPYKDICLNARITYEELFSEEKMCDSYYSLYKKVIEKRGELK